MQSWPSSKNIKQLRAFLGLTGYYRRFVRKYADIIAPLTDLLRSDSFCWTSEAEFAFKKLMETMSTTPVLRLPNFNLEFVVETDASNVGVGAVLMQSEQLIAFYSKKLSPRLQASST